MTLLLLDHSLGNITLQFVHQFGNILFTGRLQASTQLQPEEEPSRDTVPGPSSGSVPPVAIPVTTNDSNSQIMFERTYSHQPEHIIRKQPSGRLNQGRSDHHRAQSTVSAPEEPTGGFMTPPREPSQDQVDDEMDDDEEVIIPPPRPGCGECMVTLGIDLIKYFTRVLNTRTQAYRSIIIQLKKGN